MSYPFPGEFDAVALWTVADAQLAARGMTIAQLHKELGWMAKDTLVRMRANAPLGAGCHHVLPVIQWVGRTPESFTAGGGDFAGELLPEPGAAGWRWYWNIPELYAALDIRRTERELTWKQVAAEFGTTPAEINALKKAKYGMSISFTMRAARWLDRTAASFMWEHDGRGLPWSGRRTER